MPSGACVVRYAGKRGVVWRIKYADAEGRQVMETLGPERQGWTERKAEAELRERLVRVERRGWRKPAPLTFDVYSETWLEEGEQRRDWKPLTIKAYRRSLERLKAFFGPLPVASIRPRHVAEFVAGAAAEYAPATVNMDVSLGSDIFKSARREELVEANPFEGAERPKVLRRKWRILEPAEVARVAKAFTDEQARVVFLVLVLTGIRRHELQNLRWRDVDLLEGVLRVADSKTEDGVRAIALAARLQAEVAGHYQRTAFKGGKEFVFCHPERGSRYLAKTWRLAFSAALKAAEVEGKVRPFHDLRHTAITNDAAAGANPTALMAKAGHADMRTTKLYLHLAGTVFRDEAEALERRLLGVR
jgi:integrase